MVIWIFELPLDQEIRAVRVICILLGLERGLGSSRHRRISRCGNDGIRGGAL